MTRPHPPADDVRRILRKFGFDVRACDVAPFGNGHIHETFRVVLPCGALLLQHINEAVFPHPDALMENIVRVTEHLRRKIGTAPFSCRRVLTPLPASDGRFVAHGTDGSAWRLCRFEERTRSFSALPSPALACEAALAFSEFVRNLSDLPPPALHEVIPHFHDAPRRLRACEEASERDICGRAREVKREVAEIRSLSFLADAIAGPLERGEIPLRIVHNDTKPDNVLFDETENKAVCVVDLDTVMSGSILYDFGDFVRAACSPVSDDADDPILADVRIPFFEAAARGFRKGWGDMPTHAELDLMPIAGACVAFELAMRFLTDHLDGDIYFRIDRPGRNLSRCRAQLRVVRRMLEERKSLERIVRALA